MLRLPVSHRLRATILSLPFILSSAGCGTSATSSDGPSATAATASQTSAGCCASHDSQADPEAAAELAKLSPEDRALAEKQKVCPVSDALLGSMGVPIKVTVRGRTVFLCCDGCEEKLNKNADKYLAKLDHAEAKQ